jgi:murein L,D-transpeptidase YcbB/YkuD
MAFFQAMARGQLCETLRNQIEEGGIPFKKVIQGEPLRAAVSLPKFYEMNGYQPVWVENDIHGRRVAELINALKDATAHGLNPGDYHLEKIEALLQKDLKEKKPEDCVVQNHLVALEMLLTDGFLLYGSHLRNGRVNPKEVDSEWFTERDRIDMASVLLEAVKTSTIPKTFEGLAPHQAAYGKLKQALGRYRDIGTNGGWKSVPPVKKLQKGDMDERIPLIAERLNVEFSAMGYTQERLATESLLFDNPLEAAVKKFQRLRGLTDDGVVGGRTFEALNRSVNSCVRCIEINLERWRWLPRDLGQRYVLVNMADFSAQVMENDDPVLSMRAIVGTQYRETPVFSHRISYLVLNPYWHVPRKIAVEDKLPLLQKNPYLLMKQKIRIFQNNGVGLTEIKPIYVDWSTVTPYNFNYRLRQDPGPLNALGRIKFMFPNRFNVYLHDTPAKELFDKTVRTFSSGCIRVEKALELAEYLLKDDPLWPPEKLVAELDKNREKTVTLKTPVPIHLLYWTAFVDGQGRVHFRNDIYRRDTSLIQAFYARPF